MSVHSGNHTRETQTDRYDIISTPRTTSTREEAEGSRMPVEAVRELRRSFQEHYLALASSKRFVTT